MSSHYSLSNPQNMTLREAFSIRMFSYFLPFIELRKYGTHSGLFHLKPLYSDAWWNSEVVILGAISIRDFPVSCIYWVQEVRYSERPLVSEMVSISRIIKKGNMWRSEWSSLSETLVFCRMVELRNCHSRDSLNLVALSNSEKKVFRGTLSIKMSSHFRYRVQGVAHREAFPIRMSCFIRMSSHQLFI